MGRLVINEEARDRLQLLLKNFHTDECGDVYMDEDGCSDLASIIRQAETPDKTPTQAMPEGWQLVPVEPTHEMKDACDKTPGPMTAWKAWQVMLAAAPKQEPNK